MSVAANVAVGASILLTGVSFLLMCIGAISWARVRHARLLWVCVAFALFALQGILLAVATYERRAEVADGEMLLPGVAVLGLATVACLYLAVLKR
jgi:hypothetical protein